MSVVVFRNWLPAIFSSPDPTPELAAAETLAILLSYLGMVGVQVVRYRRLYDAVQRQHTMWFALALGLAIVLLLIAYGPKETPNLGQLVLGQARGQAMSP